MPAVLRPVLLVPLAGLACACARADDVPGTAAPAAPPTRAQIRPLPGVEVQYELLSATSDKAPAPGRLLGSLDAAGGQLRSSVRVDPGAQRRFGSPDTRWEVQAPGLLQTVVLGDTDASGGGWSAPARMTGLRFGRAPMLRAPRAVGEAAAAAPVPAPTLAAGAIDYEVALGRLRNGTDDSQRSYGSDYGAAAWRTGLGWGLTAEARSEWTPTASARGLELVRDGGGGSALQAVLAQSDNAQGSGLRWGMGMVRASDGATWSLDLDGAEREYTTVTGAIEPRAGVRAGARLAWGRGISTDLAVRRWTAWDAAEPTVAMDLGTQLLLASQAQLKLQLTLREGPQPGWGATMAVSVPLQGR